MDINQYKKIKPLIIGIGVAGKRHFEAQLNLGIKTGVYTTNPQTAKSLRDQENVIVFYNLDEGLDWSNLVHVCTSDNKHTEFVAKAIKKGKVVLCEKSFTTNLKDALYLQELAHKNNVIVIVGQNYRLTPTFAETKNKVLHGVLGKITKIETTYFHDVKEFKRRYPNQNFLYMGGSHAVDLACWISEKKVISVKASSDNKLNYEINLKFSSGLLGNIKLDASRPRAISGTDLIVYGEKGQLASHNKVGELNTKTLTIPLEIKIIDDYLLGKRNSYWPIPNVDEATNSMRILDTVEKIIDNVSANNP